MRASGTDSPPPACKLAQYNKTTITDRPQQTQQHKKENNENKPIFEDNINISAQRKPLHMTTSQTTPTFKATNQSDHETQVTNQAERQMHNHVSGPPTWQNLPRDITAPYIKKPMQLHGSGGCVGERCATGAMAQRQRV